MSGVDMDVVADIPSIEVANLIYAFNKDKTNVSLRTQLKEHIYTYELRSFCDDEALQLDNVKVDEIKHRNDQGLNVVEQTLMNARKKTAAYSVAVWQKLRLLFRTGARNMLLLWYQDQEQHLTKKFHIELSLDIYHFGIFLMDSNMIGIACKNLEKHKRAFEKLHYLRCIGYDALSKLISKDISRAASGFLKVFSCYEPNPYFSQELVASYAILTSILSLSQEDIEKTMEQFDATKRVLVYSQMLYANLVVSFYDYYIDNNYGRIFQGLSNLLNTYFESDQFLASNKSIYMNEMQLKVFKRYLATRSLVRISMMAEDFNMCKRRLTIIMDNLLFLQKLEWTICNEYLIKMVPIIQERPRPSIITIGKNEISSIAVFGVLSGLGGLCMSFAGYIINSWPATSMGFFATGCVFSIFGCGFLVYYVVCFVNSCCKPDGNSKKKDLLKPVPIPAIVRPLSPELESMNHTGLDATKERRRKTF